MLKLVFLATSQSGSFTDWLVAQVVALMNIIGAPGVGVAIALENLFPPLPSELLLPLAGFTAAQPNAGFSPIAAIVWATLGSLIGALALYGLGASLGHQRTVKLAEKLPLISGADIEKTVTWFQKHGYKAVFWGRMLPLFRSLISIPAGIERLNLLKFSLLTLAGSAIWNTIFILAGYFLGENWPLVADFIDTFKYALLAVLVVLVIVWLLRKFRASGKL